MKNRSRTETQVMKNRFTVNKSRIATQEVKNSNTSKKSSTAKQVKQYEDRSKAATHVVGSEQAHQETNNKDNIKN